MSTVVYILAAVLMLGIMVTVHEAGHFFAARLTGIPVKEYAIGFGPRVLSWNSKKHETKFFLRAIPAGGYCMFYGEDDTRGKEAKTDPRAIGNYPVWKRFITILMGPMMNFILALIAATLLFSVIGVQTDFTYPNYPTIRSVSAGSPAQQAGLRPGDALIAIGGEDAKGLTEDGQALKINALLDAYDPAEKELRITVQRNGEQRGVSLVPRYDPQEGRYLMGVVLNTGYLPTFTPVPLPEAVKLSAECCVDAAGQILGGLWHLVTSGDGLENSMGPLGTVQYIAEETRDSTGISAQMVWYRYIELLVVISVNLGLFNLIPIPGLDGSRLIFLLIEAIRRKPVPQKVEAYVHMSGYLVLIMLMLFMTGKDILRIFG
ncbi:MAG: site-2 protease family protein [Clostridia bacterium]|nr:site-2 protease family protein [Clostridia bacterium]